jgi:chorismate mutase
MTQNTFKNPILQAIFDANRERNWTNLARRLGKIGEEYGEVWEAYLNITSIANAKGKSYEDFFEELVDCMVVIVDCLMTPHPDYPMTDAEREAKILAMLERKLAKWAASKANQAAATQEIDDAV